MRLHLPLLVAASLVASGCYMYVPSSPQEVSPGDPVRFRLTAEEAARYQDLRLPSPRLIEGTLVERGDTAMILDALVGRAGAGEGFREMIQEVLIPRSGILEVELKRLDSTKTGLLVLGGGVALAAVVVTSGGGLGGGDDNPPDVPEARRVPLLRFNLPIGRR